MKNIIKILIFSLFAINTYGQQASEIDPKFVKLPRYANLAAITNITTGITTPTQGMMVYNIGTASNWYYNGTAWTNTLGAVSAPLSLNLTALVGTTISGVHTNSGAVGEFGGIGVRGESIGGELGSGVTGVGNGANYGVFGYSPSYIGVNGDGGIGGRFSGTTLALMTDGALRFGGFNVGTLAPGKVLTATDNLGTATWQDIPSVSAPLNLNSSQNTFSSETTGNANPAGIFGINNSTSTGHTLLVNTNGLGRSGWFRSTNPSNNSATLIAENEGSGQAIYGTNFGTGKAGVFEINSTSNSSFALHALTNGLGKAGEFTTNNPSNLNAALSASSNGSGAAVQGSSFGFGRGGDFKLYNVSNNSIALIAETDGTGNAGFFRINNPNSLSTALYASTFGLGNVARFESGNPANTNPTLYVFNNALGKAGEFTINSVSNSSTTIDANTYGTGIVGSFSIFNTSNTSTALNTSTNGSGRALWAVNSGTGNAGNFTITNISNAATALAVNTEGTGNAASFAIFNSSNSTNAISASTNGSGSAASFSGSKALETSGAIKFGGSGVGTPAAGRVLTATDALGNATWQAIPVSPIVAPLNLTSSSTTFTSLATGSAGNAGSFTINNSLSGHEALYVTSNGTSPSFRSYNTGVSSAGEFIIQNPSNGAIALRSITNGSGNAAEFLIGNATNSNSALRAITNGTGKAAYFEGTNALETNGTIKFGGSGVGTIVSGKVLTATDALGNATWQSIPAITAPLNLTSTSSPFTSVASGSSGNAGIFTITNASNGSNALSVTSIGSGSTAYFSGSKALETDGTIRFGGSGVGTIALGKVLTATDNLGHATWQSLPAVSAPLSLSSSTTTLTSTSTLGTAANFSSASGFALVTGSGNVGIGAAAPTAKLEVAGFTKLGDDATAPKIKMKELATFNTASGASAGAGLTPPQSHGLTASKIISVSVLVNVTGDLWVPPVYTSDPRLNYNYFILGSNIYIQNSSTDCTLPGDHICGKPVKVLITYKE